MNTYRVTFRTGTYEPTWYISQICVPEGEDPVRAIKNALPSSAYIEDVVPVDDTPRLTLGEQRDALGILLAEIMRIAGIERYGGHPEWLVERVGDRVRIWRKEG